MSNDLVAPISPHSYSSGENFSLIRPADIGESFPKSFENSKIDDSNEMFRKSQKNNVSGTLLSRDTATPVKNDPNNMNMYCSFKPNAHGYSNVMENPSQKFQLNQNNNQLFSEEFLSYLSMIN